jgi:hypothetical protein
MVSSTALIAKPSSISTTFWRKPNTRLNYFIIGSPERSQMHVHQRWDLLLMSSVNDVGGIPTVGKSLIIVAAVDHVLHFRIFEDDGTVFLNADEKLLMGQARQIEDLRKQLESMWPPHELTKNEKARFIAAVRSIFGRTLLHKLIRFTRKSPREQLARVQSHLVDRGWHVPHLGNDRTAYVMGLYGSGRVYLIKLIRENIGERAKYIRIGLHFHPGPTSMIYSGHATMRHTSGGQESPAVTSRVLEAVRSGFADLIFVYRHPLDSLLTNWLWWSTISRGKMNYLFSVSEAYKNTDDLCADLEQNFCEFQAFAEGDPDFFASVPGPRFLSFREFVEETELFLQAATLSLRLEDFMIDPLKEFSKIVEVMSVDVDLSRLRVAPPTTKPYRHLAVKEKVSRFRNFINELDAETKRRIEKIGYHV